MCDADKSCCDKASRVCLCSTINMNYSNGEAQVTDCIVHTGQTDELQSSLNVAYCRNSVKAPVISLQRHIN